MPLFWGRDQQDPVITPDKIEFTMGWVRKHVKLTKVLYTGCGTASTSRKSATSPSSSPTGC